MSDYDKWIAFQSRPPLITGTKVIGDILKPIDGAPKDGTSVLVWAPSDTNPKGDFAVAHCYGGEWWPSPLVMSELGGQTYPTVLERQPTHYMLLPNTEEKWDRLAHAVAAVIRDRRRSARNKKRINKIIKRREPT